MYKLCIGKKAAEVRGLLERLSKNQRREVVRYKGEVNEAEVEQTDIFYHNVNMLSGVIVIADGQLVINQLVSTCMPCYNCVEEMDSHS